MPEDHILNDRCRYPIPNFILNSFNGFSYEIYRKRRPAGHSVVILRSKEVCFVGIKQSKLKEKEELKEEREFVFLDRKDWNKKHLKLSLSLFVHKFMMTYGGCEGKLHEFLALTPDGGE
jgi:hypothetical protein